MLPPDQKRTLNRAAARFAVLNVDHLRKIMVQEMSEAASSSSMTSCTTRLAWVRMLISASPSLLVVRFTVAPCYWLRAAGVGAAAAPWVASTLAATRAG